jgi:phage FluMu protein Com
MVRLNIYDTKPITCKDCGKIIGEIDYDAEVILPKCGQCSNPIPDIKDKMPYLIKH